ncbi:MAG TPA: lysylphosphatidylglycerol synthase transmembrane domain-containing protein [Verrucomicrobiae bacterium]|nr:lysylphosphatidylglycerol synthase transmembrane domain-containing protein [Verrucomicrobiae bacterium]
MRIAWTSIIRTLFALLLMVLGGIFFVRNGAELQSISKAFHGARPEYLLVAFATSVCIVLIQSAVIRACYRSLEKDIPFREAIVLYLKRFFLSPFIPGGFSVAQYTLTKDLDHHDIKPSEHTFVSSAFVLVSATSYLILLVPIVFLVGRVLLQDEEHIYVLARIFAGAIATAVTLIVVCRPLLSRLVRKWLAPHVGHFHSKPLIEAGLLSLLVDSAGMLLLWSALHSLGIQVAVEIAAAAYVLTALVLTASPLFQGLVVVESALVFFLGKAGVPTADALAGTLIFRGFQLWLPLLVGGFVYVWPLWHKAKSHLGIE